jgi:vacuolar-type H+-ATPase subunit I/STV1
VGVEAVTYRAFKHATIQWAKAWLWELGAAQIVVGVFLWLVAKPWHPTEPAIVLAMSALALIFSGVTTMAVVAATDSEC